MELSSTALETAPTVGAVLCSSKSGDKTAQMSRRMEHCSIKDKDDGRPEHTGRDCNQNAVSVVKRRRGAKYVINEHHRLVFQDSRKSLPLAARLCSTYLSDPIRPPIYTRVINDFSLSTPGVLSEVSLLLLRSANLRCLCAGTRTLSREPVMASCARCAQQASILVYM